MSSLTFEPHQTSNSRNPNNGGPPTQNRMSMGMCSGPPSFPSYPPASTQMGALYATSSAASSVASSRTRLHCVGDDSGHSTLSSNAEHSSQLLLGGLFPPPYGDVQYRQKEELEDLEPMSRDRCNTWPMRRPTENAQASPMIHERIPEEESMFGSDENIQQNAEMAGSSLGETVSPQFGAELSPADGALDFVDPETPPSGNKKSTTRRNAWGNMSYADLITQAILSSPDKRLTLSQVYEWMVQNVPFFRDKGDSNSSAGWKPREREKERATTATRRATPSSVRFSLCSFSALSPRSVFAVAPDHFDHKMEGDFEFRGRCRTWPTRLPSPIPSNSVPLNSLNSWSPDSDTAIHSPNEISSKSRRRRSDNPTQKKLNPWGEESYAELIVRALESAPNGRLRLNEIYLWFAENVPYFGERSNAEEAAGWKNSIRHNLSLHSRFMRIQNEGAGKSSWWVINPDAKPGRNPRRRAATMESSAKAAIEKKRRGARKRVEMVRAAGMSEAGSQLSMTSHDLFNEDENPNFDTFRARTQSNLSMPGGAVSPSQTFDEFEFWPNVAPSSGLGTPNVGDILDRTDQMRIDGDSDYRRITHQQRPSPIHPQIRPIKIDEIKTEPRQQIPPPAYQEIGAMHNSHQIMSTQMAPQSLPQKMVMNGGVPPEYYQQSGGYMSTPMVTQNSINQQWIQPMGNRLPSHNQYPQQQQQHFPHQQQQQQPPPQYVSQHELPTDLESLSNLDTRIMDCDVEAVLRHELKHSNSSQIQFDI